MARNRRPRVFLEANFKSITLAGAWNGHPELNRRYKRSARGSRPLELGRVSAALDLGRRQHTYVALLTLVPVFGVLIMPFVRGAQGSRWAWRNRRWDSVAHFKRVQRAWTIWACIIYLCLVALFGLFVGGSVYRLRQSAAYALAESQLRASGEAAGLLGTPIKIGIPLGFMRSGRAVVSFSVSGPKGRGRVNGLAIKKDGLWSLGGLQLKVDGHDSMIDLLNRSSVDATDAPRHLAFAVAFRR